MTPRAFDVKTTLLEELRVIPAVAWATAGGLFLLLMIFFIPFVQRLEQRKPVEQQLPTILLQGLLVFACLILSVWLLMIFYVNADSKRRGMNSLLWTLLVIFIPNAIGFIIYFLIRDPLRVPCPKCSVPLRPDFAFCPNCSYNLSPSCAGCKRPVETGWAHCPFCGTTLAAQIGP